MVGFSAYLLYGVGKFAAYAAWCYVGVRWFAPERRSPVLAALRFGAGRLLLGIGLGLVIFLAALSMNNATRNAPLTYAAVYVPVRVGEWLLWYWVIRTRTGAASASAGRVGLWIVGGVFVSCLADVPLGIMEGGVVPVGRPFC